MAEIVNLRQARKAALRTKKRAEGTENAAKSARRKVQKSLEAAQADKARADLEAHRREPD